MESSTAMEEDLAALTKIQDKLRRGVASPSNIEWDLADLKRKQAIRQEVAVVTAQGKHAILDDKLINAKLQALDINPADLVQTKQLTFLFDAHKGEPVEVDYLLDVKTLLKRANAGTKFANVRAQFLVALGYHQGRFGFPVKPDEALRWFSKVEECSGTDHEWLSYCVYAYYAQYGLLNFTKGTIDAQHGYTPNKDKYIPITFLWVTDRYENPDRYDQAIANGKALASYAVAISDCVKAGFVPAIAFLGMRYLTDGWCVEVDPTEGLRLLKIAATEEDAPSRFYLGEIYSKGLHGVTIDLVEAHQWYQFAKDQGYPGARDALRQFSNNSDKKCTVM